MIASSIIVTSAITLIAVPGGMALERRMVASKKPQRFAWLVTIVASLGLSAVAVSLAVFQVDWPLADMLAVTLWKVLSGMLALLTVISLLVTRIQMCRSGPETLDGTAVRVSDWQGPCVVGLFRPQIVVPEWVRDADPLTRRVILNRELEHIRKRDPLLSLFEAVLRVAMPWNVPLLWQLTKLHLAVDVDCDDRVLASGLVDRSGYAQILLSTWRRAWPASLGSIRDRLTPRPNTDLSRRLHLLGLHDRGSAGPHSAEVK